MSLVIDNLSCRRGGRLVFDGLSARVDPGTAMTVRGPNGSGKSSLLRVLAALAPAVAGTARFDDLALSERSAWQERVAYVGHQDAVKPALSVARNLRIWARLFGGTGDGVDAALDRFGLTPLADRPAAQCSAGQKRRLGLARLMVVSRPLWLLDEPTVSLDARASAALVELVARHVADGGTALIATHVDLDLGDPPALHMPDGAPSGPPTASAPHEDAFLEGEWT